MPQFDVQVAAAKIGKYATSESGDSLEMIERPRGGLSLVLVDGQRSGKAAKSISNIVARKAIALLAEGVRDGAVARAAHDYLRAIRRGKVSATLNIVSVDLETESVVISRNSHCPTLIVDGQDLRRLDEPSEPVGIRWWTKPVITELPISSNVYIVVFTDGLLHAGRRTGKRIEVATLVQELASEVERRAGECFPAQRLADALLGRAIEAEQGRPRDDISVLVVAILPAAQPTVPYQEKVRRMSVRFPNLVQAAAQTEARTRKGVDDGPGG
jgi:serine phosphatase RsbU (regulator of sigma subunit)